MNTLQPLSIAEDTYYVGVNDRTKHRFEALWSLPYGVSYNSYLIVSDKVALIDATDSCHGEDFLAHLRGVLGDRPVDYLVINHMEPDHSAAISLLRRCYPQMVLVGNSKTLAMIEGFYGITSDTLEVKEGDTLPLGDKSLQFYLTPMVHWPETMMSYCPQTQVLFSGDAFGCFGALNGGVVDCEINTDIYFSEMVRYYACIVGKYGAPVQKALQKLSDLPVTTLCSTHGPVWRQEAARVVALYDRLSRFEAEEGVVLLYGSMYGNTEAMAEVIARELSLAGIRTIIMHNASSSDPSHVLRDVFTYNTLIVGSPTYTNELFPPVEALMSKLRSRDVKRKIFAAFGSFSWAGVATKRLHATAQELAWEIVEPAVEMKQGMTADKAAACIELARAVAAKIKERR